MEEKKKPIEKKEEQKKLTYEQLEQIAGNLQAQCQQLHNQLRDTQRVIAEFNEVGMLLDILDKADEILGYSLKDPILRYMIDALAADKLQGISHNNVWIFAGYMLSCCFPHPWSSGASCLLRGSR